MMWDRRHDIFTMGQWLKARIYPFRSDISPDGKHLLYFAMDGRWKSRVKGSWTALSRTPYLKAVGLWANGGHCWHGGGLFTGNTSYWLNGWTEEADARELPCGMTQRGEQPVPGNYGGECPGIYYLRLQRDGWVMQGNAFTPDGKGGTITTFEKIMPKGWVLRKMAHATIDHPEGKGCYFDTHCLHHEKSLQHHDLPDWEWADRDGDRLVWACQGKLFAAGLGAHGLTSKTELYDFNPLTFEPIEAPYESGSPRA